MKKLLYLLLLVVAGQATAQNGVIKGLIVDNQSEIPLLGANVELINSNPSIGAITDENGLFRLENVPVGRQQIRITFLGFETVSIPNIVVTAGKDAVVDIKLVEEFGKLDEVIISSKTNKERAVNKLSTVSARQFSVDEVTRFSGGRSDVGRLAANFAGVSSPDDSRNDIVVRGNSPAGLLWRLEGVPIPSPNHFSTAGTTGGPVSALNPNMLKNSDFLTSAFAAEYGNALGGVFDLGFRKGNRDDYEYSLQVGVFSGVEANVEGPLGKTGGSFLVAGRYSLVGLLGQGAGGTAATPNYGDISLNLDLGRSKAGNFSIFGILGTSDIDFIGDEIDEDDLFAAEDEDTFVVSGFGVLGLKHRINLNDNSYIKTTLSGSYSLNEFTANRFLDFETPQERNVLFTEADNRETRLSVSSFYNSKLSKKATLRVGAVYENINFNTLERGRDMQPDLDGDGDPDLFTFSDIEENFGLYQPFVLGQWRLTEKLTINGGLHGQYSTLNEQFVLEPRAAANYALSPKSKISIGYGLHHQLQPLPILFLNEEINGQLVQTNRDLDFTRSNHFVLGYDVRLAKSWRGKLEVYYQSIDNAGVEAFPSSYSTLTEGAAFGFDNDRVSLVNEGSGFNQGIELTVEKFFDQGFYGLITTSIFESKYEGNDGIERNTPFNNGYVLNILAGKEFKLGVSGRNNWFVDTKITTSGGRYFTPADLEASQQAGFEVLQEDIAFSEQNDPYFRWDVKFGVKLNSTKKKQSHQFYFDLQNVTNNNNLFQQRYNRVTNMIDEVDQIGFFPDVGYRFQF